MKKLFKGIVFIVMLLFGLVTGLIFILEPLQKMAFEKFGEEEVRAYMKRFEPYIVLSDDEKLEEEADQ